jgi:Predicted phosphohydrolases
MNKDLTVFQIIFSFLCFLISQGLFAQGNFPTEFPDRIVLNATPDPTTSFAVSWRTSTAVGDGICEVQPLSNTRISSDKSISVKAATRFAELGNVNETIIPVNVHSAVVSGLSPGNKYLYRVGNGRFWSEWFEVHLPANNSDFSFIYFGDPQVSLKSEWSRVVRKAYQMVPDCQFMLYAGDIINRSGSDMEWNEWFYAGSYLFSTIPQILTPGNHDYKDQKLDSHWDLQFHQPQNGPKGLKGTCFFVDYPNLRLISIDSASGDELENENGYEMTVQKAWLDSVLQTNTKKWIVVTTHLPFYSTKDTRDNPQLRKNFQPILEKYKVDLVLTGHDHSYGRGRATDTVGIKPTVNYVVSVSGPKLYQEGTKTWMERKGGNIQLFQKITVMDKSLLYEAYSVSGEKYDSFRIDWAKNGHKIFQNIKQE